MGKCIMTLIIGIFADLKSPVAEISFPQGIFIVMKQKSTLNRILNV